MRRLFPVLLLAFLTFGMPRVAEAQVTVAPFLTSNPQFFDGSGSPLNSGCVFTYAAGTTTPLVTYSDSAGSTPNSNPVILNSGGFPQSGGIWLTAAAYKFVVKTTGGSNCSTGSTITTTDGITWSTPLSTFNGITSIGNVVIQPATAATGGANQSSPTVCIQGFYFNVTSLTDQWCLSNVVGTGPAPTSTFTVAHSGSGGAATILFPGNVSVGATLGAGTAQFSLLPWVDPMQATYGAKCDGTTDDSVALQAAITAAINNGSWLYIPAGKTCAHASTLNMNITSSSVKIFGKPYGSTLKYTGTGSGWLWKNGNGTPFIFTPWLSGISFECSNTLGCAKGIEAWSWSEGVLRDVGVGGNFAAGFASTALWCSACNILDVDHLILNGQTTMGVNVATLGLDCLNCAAMFIHAGDFFYFPTATMRFSGTLTAHIEIAGNWFESQDKAILIDDSIGVTTLDTFQVHNNRFLFDGAGGVAPSGGGFANQVAVYFNNTGANSMPVTSFQFAQNSVQEASGLTSTPYPIVLNISPTTGAGTNIQMDISRNRFNGATSGMANVIGAPSVFNTRLNFDRNNSVNASGTLLPLEVNGSYTGSDFSVISGSTVIGRNTLGDGSTLFVEDNQPTVGKTVHTITAGPNQGTTNLVALKDNTNTVLAQFSAAANLQFSNCPAALRGMLWATGGANRWWILPAGTESGGNAGCDFAIDRYNDAGVFQDAPFQIVRSSGLVEAFDGFATNLYKTLTNCTSAGGTCVAAPAGVVTIAAAASTVTVATTAVAANSDIILTRNNGLGTRLSVTCNTQSSLVLGTPYVSAISAGVSFTITIDVAPTTNPLCLSYSITN